MKKSMGVIKYNNRIIDAIENIRMLGGIDRKTEGLIRLKIQEVFSSINSEAFPGSNFTRVQIKYKKEIDRIFNGDPKYFGGFVIDLIDVIQFVLFRLEYEREGVKKSRLSWESEKENSQMISEYLNKIVAELIIFIDVLEDCRYKLNGGEIQ